MRPLTAVLAGGCGLAMAVAAGAGTSTPAAGCALLAVAAVLAGYWLRPAATVAVLLTVIALAVGDPSTALAAAAGLAAVAYLLLRYAADGVAALTAPTMIAALGFAGIGLVAAGFPLQLPWLSLVAAPAAFGCYVLAVCPFAAR